MTYKVSLAYGGIKLSNSNMVPPYEDWFFSPNQIPSLKKALDEALARLEGKSPEWLVDEPKT